MCVFLHILVVPTLFKNGLQNMLGMAWMIFFLLSKMNKRQNAVIVLMLLTLLSLSIL